MRAPTQRRLQHSFALSSFDAALIYIIKGDEAENPALKGELAAAREKIKELEQRRIRA